MTENIVNEDKLEKLLRECTPRQRKFLLARREVSTDKELAKQKVASEQTIANWKKLPIFRRAYDLIIQAGNADLLSVSQEDLAKQREAMSEILPLLVQKHINIALHGEKETDSLRAIERLYELAGFKPKQPEQLPNQNKVFVQMLTILGPQAVVEANRRGVNVNNFIEGEFSPFDDKNFFLEDGEEEE